MRAERGGQPVTDALTGGERHEQIALPTLLETGAVRRLGGSRPRVRPCRRAGDKGHSSATVRRYLRRRRIGAVIPRRRTEPRARRFERAASRERNGVERLITRRKQFRAIATRDDELAVTYHAGLIVVSILLWL